MSDFRTELNRNGKIIYTNVGDSMMPLIKQGRDVLIIEKTHGRLKKYDIPLYQRDSGQYVLHRILKVREKDYVICGDNRWQKETGITDRHIIGVLTGIIHNGKEIKVFLSKAELNAEDRKMIEFMFGSGTYGTEENVIKRRAGFLHADSKGKYLFRRIFPSMEHYRMYFPTAAKYPVLIPFVWVFRLFRAVTVRKSWYTHEISSLKNTSGKELMS